MPKGKREVMFDFQRATEILETQWQAVTAEAATRTDLQYVSDQPLRSAIESSVNHGQVAYRFCLPIQLHFAPLTPFLPALVWRPHSRWPLIS